MSLIDEASSVIRLLSAVNDTACDCPGRALHRVSPHALAPRDKLRVAPFPTGL
jgi:hypothetical protein